MKNQDHLLKDQLYQDNVVSLFDRIFDSLDKSEVENITSFY